MSDKNDRGNGPNSSAMVAISLQELLEKSQLNVDLFLRLSPTKHILVIKAGRDPDHSALRRYLSRGVHSLYVRSSDYNAMIARSLVEASTSAPTGSVETFTEISRDIWSEIQSLGIKDETAPKASSSTDWLSGLGMRQAQFRETLDNLRQLQGGLTRHAAATSLIAVMLAIEMGWEEKEILDKLSLAGFLHDIGLTKVPRDIASKAQKKMSRDELIIYESHAEVGRDLVDRMKFVHPDVARIVWEHHEHVNGTGFPRKLKEGALHTLTNIVSVASEFTNLILNDDNGREVLPARGAYAEIDSQIGQKFAEKPVLALRSLLILNPQDLKKAANA